MPIEDGGMDEVDARLRLVLDADYDAALEDAEFAARLARRKAGLAKQKAKVEVSSGVVQVRSRPTPSLPAISAGPLAKALVGSEVCGYGALV